MTCRNGTVLLMRTGAVRGCVVASPSCPCELAPQQNTSVPLASPHVCENPVVICGNVRSRATSSGVGRDSWAPSPNWPSELLPQQAARPSLPRVHECPYPAAIVPRNSGKFTEDVTGGATGMTGAGAVVEPLRTAESARGVERGGARGGDAAGRDGSAQRLNYAGPSRVTRPD